MGGNVTSEEQKILDSLRIKFVASAQEKLSGLKTVVDDLRVDSHQEGLEFFLNELHTLKGLGGTFGFRDFSQIATRLENYLEGRTEVTSRHLDEIEIFMACLLNCINREKHPSVTELDQILSELPVR